MSCMSKPCFGSWALLLASLLANSSWCLPTPSCATVSTTSGFITGHPARNRTGISEYLGIPYAQPPLGCLRFAAPEKLALSDAPFNASTFQSDCPANIAPPSTFPNFTGNGFRVYSAFTGRAGNRTNPQSEDCLTLNVWTKTPLATHAQPVFIWLHGGRFSIPGSHSPFYNGQYLADDEDVVVVTINYRVNIFGFSGAPGEVQNVGLLDQRLAVEWVRDNIQGFGGDPARITLFGQSAGGASVDYYSYAWTRDPIVSGLISHSGTALSFTPNSPDLSAKYFYNVSAALGCGGAGSRPKTVVDCVRSKDTTDILKAVALVPAAPSPALPQPAFHPTVDNRTVFANYSALSSNGSFMKVPYIVGNNNNEAGTYRLSAFAAKKNLTEAQWAAYNLAGFTCPSAREAAARAKHGVPVWRYRYFGDWPNLRLYPGSGAYHGSELSLIFGTAHDVSGQPNSPTEEATARYMMKAWASFARDPMNGLRAFGWPVYNPKGGTLVRLAYENQTTASFVPPGVYDDLCPAVNDPSPAQGAF